MGDKLPDSGLIGIIDQQTALPAGAPKRHLRPNSRDIAMVVDHLVYDSLYLQKAGTNYSGWWLSWRSSYLFPGGHPWAERKIIPRPNLNSPRIPFGGIRCLSRVSRYL